MGDVRSAIVTAIAAISHRQHESGRGKAYMRISRILLSRRDLLGASAASLHATKCYTAPGD